MSTIVAESPIKVTTTELYAKCGDRSTELCRWDELEITLRDAKVTGGNDTRASLAVVYDRSDDDHDTVVMHPDEDRPLEAVERSIAALAMVRDALVQLGHVDFTPSREARS